MGNKYDKVQNDDELKWQRTKRRQCLNSKSKKLCNLEDEKYKIIKDKCDKSEKVKILQKKKKQNEKGQTVTQ